MQHSIKGRRAIHSVPTLNPTIWNNFLPAYRFEMARGIIDFLKATERLSDRHVHVLNLGAGVGETSSFLEKLHPPFLITDVDQIPYRKGLMHQRYLQSDVAKLPLLSNSYDVLFSSFTFSYLGNRKEVMLEWMRVLKPGGDAYFVFHAPHSTYLNTAREMVHTNIAQDFLQLVENFPGTGFTGLYDWFCRHNFAWRMAFPEEQNFLGYAHTILVYDHLVNEISSLMFENDTQIIDFFENLKVTDISVNILCHDFTVLPFCNASTTPMAGWFVSLRT